MIANITRQPVVKLLTTKAEVSAIRSALLIRTLQMEQSGEAEGKKGTGPAEDYRRLIKSVLPALDKVWNDTRLYETV